MLPGKAGSSPLMWLQEYMNISPYLTKVANKERGRVASTGTSSQELVSKSSYVGGVGGNAGACWVVTGSTGFPGLYSLTHPD